MLRKYHFRAPIVECSIDFTEEARAKRVKIENNNKYKHKAKTKKSKFR